MLESNYTFLNSCKHGRVILRWFSEDADVCPSEETTVGLETALECVRQAVRGMLYADDVCIVSQLPCVLQLIIVFIVQVCEAFGLTASEKKTETMHMPIPYRSATPNTLTAAGQPYR